MRRRSLLGAVPALATLGTFGSAWTSAVRAQSKYPDRPIRLVVPFVPGGETDYFGRTWATFAGMKLGTTIVVDNKAGAGGSIGTAEVARSKPDGYTLLAGTSSTQVITPAAQSKGVTTTAQVVGAAATEMHRDSAVVLIFVNQLTTSKERPDPTMASSSVLVSVAKQHGDWLITKFDPV